jgi:hypothetical protein
MGVFRFMSRTTFALMAAVSSTMVIVVVVAAVGYVAYFGLPSHIVSLLMRPVTPPTNDGYAVYSAFIDNFFTTEQPFRADQSINNSNLILVADETLSFGANTSALLPLNVVALGPADMGEDFFRQNQKHWRLAANLNARIHTKLVNTALKREAARYGMEELFAADDDKKWLPHASPNGPFPEDPDVSGVLQLSRVGFDWRGRVALIYFDYRCGFLCGQSGWVALEKNNSGWRVQHYGAGNLILVADETLFIRGEYLRSPPAQCSGTRSLGIARGGMTVPPYWACASALP